MGLTSIEWADRTINPVRARNRETGRVGHWCEKVSPGCKNCYSSAWQRFRGQGHAFEIPYREHVNVYFHSGALREVLTRRPATRWFWCDMTDMFGAWVPDDWIAKCFAAMALTPQHTHLVLTKRPERMRQWLTRAYLPGAVCDEMQFPDWLPTGRSWPRTIETWPLPNVHLGVSVEDQATADERIPLLLQTPAAVRWVSYEPALGPVDFAGLCTDTFNALDGIDFESIGDIRDAGVLGKGQPERGLDWIVVGGESGPGARPFDLAWARATVEQCRAAHTPVFVKQLGGHPHDRLRCLRSKPGMPYCSAQKWSRSMTVKDRKGGDMAEWPADLRVREFPTERSAR